LRKTADFSADDYFPATIRKNPQISEACKPMSSAGIAALSASPQNPQPLEEKSLPCPEATLLRVASKLQACPNRLRALMSNDDILAIAEGVYSQAYLLAHFGQMRSDGIPLADDRPTIPCAAKAPDSRQRYAKQAEAWQPAFDAFINHLMAPCPNCYAPGDRYCSLGAELNNAYRNDYEKSKACLDTPPPLSCPTNSRKTTL
jgi:hypothetical protein